MYQIIIVEDDPNIREILSFNIENAGYEVAEVASAEEIYEVLTPNTDLILLDVMLPGINGFQLANELRLKGNNVPIIFLTALTEECDKLKGFSAGGDDYIQKPFSINEVLARIGAVLKRSASHKKRELTCGELYFDFDAGIISLSGNPLVLSRKEYDIFAFLAQHPDNYYSRENLIEELWKEAPYILPRTVDVHIARIRGKLGEFKDIIKNKSGFGYYLDTSYEIQK